MNIISGNGKKFDPNIIYICVPEEEYRNLLADQLRYEALDDGGVDDWEWFSYSLYNFKTLYAQEYGDKFINWVEKRKDPNITVNQYIKSVMDFEDLAEFEIEMTKGIL